MNFIAAEVRLAKYSPIPNLSLGFDGRRNVGSCYCTSGYQIIGDIAYTLNVLTDNFLSSTGLQNV